MKLTPKKFYLLSGLLLVTVLLFRCTNEQEPPAPTMTIQDKINFTGEVELPERRSSFIDYDWSVLVEKFRVGVPAAYNPDESYGLIVFIGSSFPNLPESWYPVLAKHKMLFIAPYGLGNKTEMPRRTGVAVVARQVMMREYPNIDPKRVYIAGISGGARTACGLAFLHPELFRGTIQSVGAGFPEDVPHVKAKKWVDTNGNPYGGIYGAEDADIKKVKETVRFVMITGDGDFRQPHIHDIHNGGYKPQGYKALLIDTPGMKHECANAEQLEEALQFIEASD